MGPPLIGFLARVGDIGFHGYSLNGDRVNAGGVGKTPFGGPFYPIFGGSKRGGDFFEISPP